MAQKSIVSTNQMFAFDSESSNRLVHPDHHFLTGNASDYANRNVYPVLPLPVSTMNLHQFKEYHERLLFYGNEYNTVQNCQAMQNLGLSAAGPNLHNSNLLLTPSRRNFPVGQSNVMAEQLPLSISQIENGNNMDELSWHNWMVETDMSCKRKVFDMIRRGYYSLNGSASSSLPTSYNSNCCMPQWGQSFESLPQMVDPNFSLQEYEGGVYLPGVEGSHRTGQSRSVATCSVQPELAFLPHHNCLIPGSYTTLTSCPANSAWVSQFANVNNYGDVNSTWNQKNPVIYLQGRCVDLRPVEMGNISMQPYSGSSCGLNSALLFHQSSMPNFHPPVQNLNVQSYRTHAHIPASSQHAINNLSSISSRHSGEGLDTGAIYPRYPADIGQIYGLRQLHSNGNLSLLPAEGVTLANLSSFEGVGNAIDQHHDMRLDIDDMSYEELLALEERIGVVKTGLAEEFVMQKLRTRVYSLPSSAPTSKPSSENQGCAICQVEYEANEVIGSLDCDHSYHANCIKQWLLIKNLCPICKTSGLDTVDKDLK